VFLDEIETTIFVIYYKQILETDDIIRLIRLMEIRADCSQRNNYYKDYCAKNMQ